MGGGPFTAFSSSTQVAQAAESLSSTAVRWKPGESPSVGDGTEPCGLQSLKSTARFSVTVHWAPFTLDMLRNRVPREPYEPVGDGLYLQRSAEVYPVLRLAMACKVRGAPPEQAAALPLEVQVRLERLTASEARLQEDVVLHVARQMVRYIPCRNRPRIPDTVTVR
ncbi:hypothetical protein [Streptomyces sp. NPDC056600]|uniref:hypothetical protein n=1 Tax=Streptomyces sp. NPDC056600 TaxID=3345874 RepID=UPI0036ACF04F